MRPGDEDKVRRLKQERNQLIQDIIDLQPQLAVEVLEQELDRLRQVVAHIKKSDSVVEQAPDDK